MHGYNLNKVFATRAVDFSNQYTTMISMYASMIILNNICSRRKLHPLARFLKVGVHFLDVK